MRRIEPYSKLAHLSVITMRRHKGTCLPRNSTYLMISARPWRAGQKEVFREFLKSDLRRVGCSRPYRTCKRPKLENIEWKLHAGGNRLEVQSFNNSGNSAHHINCIDHNSSSTSRNRVFKQSHGAFSLYRSESIIKNEKQKPETLVFHPHSLESVISARMQQLHLRHCMCDRQIAGRSASKAPGRQTSVQYSG